MVAHLVPVRVPKRSFFSVAVVDFLVVAIVGLLLGW